MAFFGNNGEFGAWLLNPQYGSGTNQTGFWDSNITPLTSDLGPLGGWYKAGEGFRNKEGFVDQNSLFADFLKRADMAELWKRQQDKYKKGGIKGLIDAIGRDRGAKGFRFFG